jgi:hypothetical protein
MPTPATVNKLQEAIGQSIATENALDAVLGSFKPEYLKTPKQMEQGAAGLAIRWGLEGVLTPDAIKEHGSWSAFSSNASSLIRDDIVATGGKTMTPQEVGMSKMVVPNLEDNHVKFLAKAVALRKRTAAARIRSLAAMEMGFGPEGIEAALGAMGPKWGMGSATETDPPGVKTSIDYLNRMSQELAKKLEAEGMSRELAVKQAEQQVKMHYEVPDAMWMP